MTQEQIENSAALLYYMTALSPEAHFCIQQTICRNCANMGHPEDAATMQQLFDDDDVLAYYDFREVKSMGKTFIDSFCQMFQALQEENTEQPIDIDYQHDDAIYYLHCVYGSHYPTAHRLYGNLQLLYTVFDTIASPTTPSMVVAEMIAILTQVTSGFSLHYKNEKFARMVHSIYSSYPSIHQHMPPIDFISPKRESITGAINFEGETLDEQLPINNSGNTTRLPIFWMHNTHNREKTIRKLYEYLSEKGFIQEDDCSVENFLLIFDDPDHQLPPYVQIRYTGSLYHIGLLLRALYPGKRTNMRKIIMIAQEIFLKPDGEKMAEITLKPGTNKSQKKEEDFKACVRKAQKAGENRQEY